MHRGMKSTLVENSDPNNRVSNSMCCVLVWIHIFYWWGQNKFIQLPILGDVNIHLVNGPPKLEVSCSTQANVFTSIHKKAMHSFVRNFLDKSSPMAVHGSRTTHNASLASLVLRKPIHVSTEISRNPLSWRLMQAYNLGIPRPFPKESNIYKEKPRQAMAYYVCSRQETKHERPPLLCLAKEQ